jgi:hypothetical protein
LLLCSFEQNDHNNVHQPQSRNSHRDLFFLPKSTFCVHNDDVPGESYKTFSVLTIFTRIMRLSRIMGVDGRCGTVCPSICNHQPCFADYVSPDDDICECFRDGSYQCNINSFCDNERDLCTCNTGYEGDPFTGCVDIDECRDPNICGRNGVCVNTPGSYECD